MARNCTVPVASKSPPSRVSRTARRVRLCGHSGTWTATHPGLPVSGLEPQLDVLSATAAVIVLQRTHLARRQCASSAAMSMSASQCW